MGAYTHKPLTGTSCGCGRPAWGNGPRCRACVSRAQEQQDMEGYGPAEMRRDVLLADRPRLRMRLEELNRRCPSQLVLVTREILNGNNDMAG